METVEEYITRVHPVVGALTKEKIAEYIQYCAMHDLDPRRSEVDLIFEKGAWGIQERIEGARARISRDPEFEALQVLCIYEGDFFEYDGGPTYKYKPAPAVEVKRPDGTFERQGLIAAVGFYWKRGRAVPSFTRQAYTEYYRGMANAKKPDGKPLKPSWYNWPNRQLENVIVRELADNATPPKPPYIVTREELKYSMRNEYIKSPEYVEPDATYSVRVWVDWDAWERAMVADPAYAKVVAKAEASLAAKREAEPDARLRVASEFVAYIGETEGVSQGYKEWADSGVFEKAESLEFFQVAAKSLPTAKKKYYCVWYYQNQV